MAKRQKIPRRKRFFIACEGESEQGYAALLQKFANDAQLPIHIVAKVMTSAGDPLAMTQRAVAQIKHEEAGSRSAFVDRFLQFDTDLIGQNPDRDGRMIPIADRAKLILIRQDICFESFLLRHFKGHENDRPTTNAEALSRLKGVWPEYRKGSSAQDLAKRIQLKDVQKAATNHLNVNFAVLLNAIGLGN